MRNRFILFASRSLVGFASALVWLVLGAAMMDVCQAQTGPGSALAFDGTGYVEVDSMPNLPLNNQLTLEAWVRPANSGCMTIASRGVGDFNSDYIFALSYDGVSACGNASLNLFCAGAWHISSTNVVPANVWTHVAVTFDGTTKKFYINGMLNATRPYSGVINQTGTPFFVGRQGCNCSYSYFTGQIDEVRLWDTVRTAAQISQSFNQRLTGSETGLVAYYRFDEGHGSSAVDGSGHSNLGSLGGGVSWVSSGALFMPDLNTGAATAIAPTGATLNGTVNPGNLQTSAWFQWGTTTNYGSNTAITSLAATNTALSASNALALLPTTTYHFRIVATNTAGTNFGSDLTLTTPAVPILGTAALCEGPAPGLESVFLVVSPNFPWTATANAPWLHVAAGYQSGSVSTNVVFSFDANPGVTRTGTVTIATRTLTVIQAGANYISPSSPLTLVSNLNNPGGVALDLTGNVYIADSGNNAIKEWVAASNTVTTLVSSGLNNPQGLTVDAAGNVYIADSSNNAIKEWIAASNTVSTLISSGLAGPTGVALDAAGNVYLTDRDHTYIKEWSPATTNVTTLFYLVDPWGISLDLLGNVYVDDARPSLRRWTPGTGQGGATLVSLAPSMPYQLAVDGGGNIFYADEGNNSIGEWIAVSNTVVSRVSSGLYHPQGVGLDGAGNIYIADTVNNAVKELPRVFLDPRPKLETLAAGTDTLPAVVPTTFNLLPPFAPSTDQPWLTISGITNGVVSFACTASTTPRVGNIYLLGQTITVTQFDYMLSTNLLYVGPAAASNGVVLAVNPVVPQAWTATSQASWLHLLTTNGSGSATVGFTCDANPGLPRNTTITIAGQTLFVVQQALGLGTTARVVGPAAGMDSVVLASFRSPWTATANAAWLHLSADNQSGTGSLNVVFSFDANTGPTRSGTLTIAGMTLTVTQAGVAYLLAGPTTTLPIPGLGTPYGVATGPGAKVYIADYGNNVIKQWSPGNSVTTLPIPGLYYPTAVALDAFGNLFISDYHNLAIKMWSPITNTVLTLMSGFNSAGVAVDGAGDVFAADTNAIRQWSPATQTVLTPPIPPLFASGVAVDVAGNVYIDDFGLYQWSAESQNLAYLPSPGLNNPLGIAVDGAGNVYVADTDNNAVDMFSPVTQTTTVLPIYGLHSPGGVAVDSIGNIFVADTLHNAIKELPHAFVDPTPKLESEAAGSDSLAAVVPNTADLSGVFAPASDQPWLTITGVTNGVVSFSFTSTTTDRTANISLLGQQISVTQLVTVVTLGATNLWEGPAAGLDSVVVVVSPPYFPWTTRANDSWLHLDPANQGGTGATNVVFSLDANPGPTRTGSLTIAGRTLTIIQAGSTYAPATPLTTLVSSGLFQPNGVAVDSTGNVYIADSSNNAIKEWVAASNTLITLVSSGLSQPRGVAVDSAGNVYIADVLNNAVKKWSAASNIVTTLVSSGLNQPSGVAVDAAGNVYIADRLDSAVKEWVAASNTVTTLVSSGLDRPFAVAVDAANNVYIADTYHNALKEWVVANNSVITLGSVTYPSGVAVDGSGNVYAAEWFNQAVHKWSATDHSITNLVSLGTNAIAGAGVAVDGLGNVYFCEGSGNFVAELPRAFVDPTPKNERAAAASDVLPTVLPPTENLLAPFAPTSDQSWLTLTGVTNGVVSFSFTSTTTNRTANISLLGLQIPVTQTPVFGTATTLTGVRLFFGRFQFIFTNTPGATFTVLTTTNLSLPLTNWTPLGAPVESPAGHYRFTGAPATNTQQFYILRSP